MDWYLSIDDQSLTTQKLFIDCYRLVTRGIQSMEIDDRKTNRSIDTNR